MKKLIQFISFFRKFKALQIFTIYLRYLIGGAFVMAAVGMGKLSASPIPLALAANKPIQELEPIQLFFRVMAESGLYWNFIGWSQIIAGGLLMTQSGQARELHPHLPTEPCVRLSPHTALHVYKSLRF